MYLQLAEQETEKELNPFIFVPDISGQSKGMYVREDFFDSLTDREFDEMMNTLAPFQPDVQARTMSEDWFLADRASRRRKRAEKDAKKREKKAGKEQKRKENKERRAETLKSIVGSFGGAVSSIFGKPAPGGDEVTSPEPEPETESKPIWKNPLFWVGTGLVVGGGIYLATRKR